jgi:hypothetical protein
MCVNAITGGDCVALIGVPEAEDLCIENKAKKTL